MTSSENGRNAQLAMVYHIPSTCLVLPKKTPNHTHRTIGDMQASELACLNSNYISSPYRIRKRVRVIERITKCAHVM